MAEWVMGVIASLGYLGIALLMLAENLFPPLPSELIMPFAGFLAARRDPCTDPAGVSLAYRWPVHCRADGLASIH